MLKSYLRPMLAKLKGGFTTNKKLVVIESDDWGSIRMSSKEAYKRLLKKGYRVDTCAYNKFDILESDEDIEKLVGMFHKIKRETDKTPVITLNICTANPDFEKIKKNKYKNYYWEPFTETYKKYPNSKNVVKLIKEGIEEGFFQVQYHGREHLNVARWMKALRAGDKAVCDAFEENVFSPKVSETIGYRMEYMDALDYDSKEESETKEKILRSGYDVFREVWGQESKSFIAPCYRWDDNVERTMKDLGVKYFQGQRKHSVPKNVKGFELELRFHHTGEINKINQIYMVRNVFFEPSMSEEVDWCSKSMKEIEKAFLFRQPVIISMHRINFVGGLNLNNREKNLELFEKLLFQVIFRYPDVEFVSSDQLGDIIQNG